MDGFSMSGISDAVGDALGTTLNNTLGRILYVIVSGINWILSLVYRVFEVFSGQIKVSYDGDSAYLLNIFF